jgi:hypothetical protein
VTEISDDYMRQMMTTSRDYSVVILHATGKRTEPDADEVLWEHARRNFALRVDGVLSIICRVADDSDVRGIGIFNATVDETRAILDEDPGVKAGVFTYEVHKGRGFPRDRLPD